MQEAGVDSEMFTIMSSRWFYLSDKFLIGRHPEKDCLILVVRNGQSVPPMEIERVLQLNSMTLCGPLVSENGTRYYNLEEVKDDKATSSRVSGFSRPSTDQTGGRRMEHADVGEVIVPADESLKAS
jgi:hypothetical protein